MDVKHGSPSLGLAHLATGLAQTPILAVGLEFLQIKYIITKGSSPDPDPEPWDPYLTLARCLKGEWGKSTTQTRR